MACFAEPDINVSQGSGATYARCGGIFNINLTTNLPRNLPVQIFLLGSHVTELWRWVCGSTFLAHPVHCSWTDRPVSGQRPLYVFPVRWNHFISCRRHYRLAVIDEADSKPAAVAQWGWMREQRVDISFSLARRRCTSTKTPCAAHIGNVSLPIQLTQCRFPGLAISNAKILIYFSNKIHRSNFIKQHSETVMVWNYRKCWLQFKKKILCHLL